MQQNKSIKIIFGGLGLLLLLVIGLYLKVFILTDSVAYIDTSKLLQQSKQMEALRKELEKEQSLAKSNLDTLTNEFQNQLKEYEKNISKMSTKEKQLSQELLRTKQQQLVQYQQAVQHKVQEEEQKKTQELLTSINAQITEYGEKSNYKLILATSNGNIAYGDKGVDITEEIIEKINQ
jgi:outer membrane protein